ncbi:MAG: MATE family efflux transporter [Candidatus Ancillula sp.]|jgi:putative MATE family efflux protein|nr:MATE family efflux transporter [Candidatus Ancillula sp.]
MANGVDEEKDRSLDSENVSLTKISQSEGSNGNSNMNILPDPTTNHGILAIKPLKNKKKKQNKIKKIPSKIKNKVSKRKKKRIVFYGKKFEFPGHFQFTHNQLKKMLLPLAIEQTLAITLGFVDTIMVSHAGEAAVSGVSLVNEINNLLFNFMAALATGGAILAGQFLGSRNKKGSRYAAGQLMVTVLSISVVLTILCALFCRPMLSLLFGAVEKDVMDNAVLFMTITSFTFPFMAIQQSAAALFRIMGNTKVAMQNAIIMNGMNLVGNYIFIFLCNWGAAGSASATLIARAICALTIYLRLKNTDNAIYVKRLIPRHIDFKMIKRIITIGLPNGIESGLFSLGRVILTSLVATMGLNSMAANAVALSLTSAANIPGIAIGLAITTTVSQAMGAGDKKQAKDYVSYLIRHAYFYEFIFNFCIGAFCPFVLALYGLQPEAFNWAHQIIIIHSIGAATLWTASFAITNTFRAAGDVKYPMVISIASMFICRIGTSLIFDYVFHMGVISIWLGMMVDWLARAIIYVHHYKSERWARFQVV